MRAHAENTPLVSVIVLTYNQEAYIAQTIDSILAQKTSFPFEIIIGDDCSTDATSSICSSYALRYPQQVRYIRREQNMGLVANYYDIFLRCKGTYVADCGGDDYWIDVSKLQLQVDILEQNEDVVLVHTNWKELHVTQDRVVSDIVSQFNPNKEVYMAGKSAMLKLLAQRELPFVFLCSACFRHQPVLALFQKKKDLFIRPEYLCEDWQLIFLSLTLGKLYFLDRETVMYRIASGTMSRPVSDRKQMLFAVSNFSMRLRSSYYAELGVSAQSEYVRRVFFDFFWFSLRLREDEPLRRGYEICQEFQLDIGQKNRRIYRLLTIPRLFSVISEIYTILRNGYKRLKKVVKRD